MIMNFQGSEIEGQQDQDIQLWKRKSAEKSWGNFVYLFTFHIVDIWEQFYP